MRKINGVKLLAFSLLLVSAVLWMSSCGEKASPTPNKIEHAVGIIIVAKYAQPMSGASDALQDCDFTDLDEDGNSDLTANFSFTDGTTASLTWFYADGSFVYNEEFSALPGDVPAGNAE